MNLKATHRRLLTAAGSWVQRPGARTLRIWQPVLILLGLASVTAPAAALDYQFHGFAAQGFSLSDGNNYFGDSRHGSGNFYELGLNSTVAISPDLLVSAQGILRRAGRLDTEGLRLDFAQLDYRLLSTTRSNAGLRIGKVKNPYGFFNDTRDVVFTRPGIVLPESVYYERSGLRSVIFSREGGQLYGDLALGEHTVSLSGNYGLNFDLDAAEKRNLLGSSTTLPNDIRVSEFYVARLQDDWNAGRIRLAASYLHAAITVQPTPASPIEGRETASFWLLSAQYNQPRYSLTGEYVLQYAKARSNIAAPFSIAGDGFYLQADYRIQPQWTVVVRYEASFSNRHDRDGREYAEQTGGDRHDRFSHDEMIGLNWSPTQHWGFWAEFHLIQGHSNVGALDNLGRTLADRSKLLQVMAAYRF